MRYLLFFVMFFSIFFKAQVVNKTDSNKIKPQDSIVIDSGRKDSLRIFKPTIADYKLHTQFSEKKILDTTLTIDKYYRFTQWNNKDNFGKIQFANIGSGYKPLVYEYNKESSLQLLPTNKSFGIITIYDILYYDVKTPTTTFIYHNAARNGAALESTYTQNIGKNFNFSINYMGLRSQGFYRNSLASNNNTYFTAHYLSKNSKYEFFAHYLHQNVNNQEYGGIIRDDLFQAGDNDFRNRTNAQVNLETSNSRFAYRRYYFSQQFAPFNSERFPFRIKHTIFHQGNKYYYSQNNLETYYYDAPSDVLSGFPLFSKKFSENLSNTFSVLLDNSNFKLEAGIRHQLLQLGVENAPSSTGYDAIEIKKENRIGFVGKFEMKILDKILLDSDFEFSKGSQFGNLFSSYNNLKFEPIKNYFINAKVNFHSAVPTFNYLVNNSVYKKFNYYFPDLKNQTVTEIGGDVNLNWLKSKLFVNYFMINNFTYFNSDGKPLQSDSPTNISQIGGDATFSFKNFHANTRLQFQGTLTNKELFLAPNFIGRLNLYYQSKAFKNAAEIQTGIKTYYFSKFNSRDYFPVLNEFILPNSSSFATGGIPVVDLYFNMKVKRMFFFIEGQNIATTFMDNKLYTAPHYPYSDFRLNIGIVWYLIN